MTSCPLSCNLPLVLGIAFPLVVLAVLILMFRGQRQALAKINTVLPGKLDNSWFNPSFVGDYHGFPFSVSLRPARDHQPAYFYVTLLKPSSFKVSISHDSMLARLGKRLGIIHEVKINDTMFDVGFYISSNKASQATAYLKSAAVKAAIRELFSLGFQAFSIDGKRISVHKEIASLSEFDPVLVGKAIEQLSFAAQGLYST